MIVSSDMTDIFAELTAAVHAGLDALEAAGTLPPGCDRSNVTMEQPKDVTHGDFATNAAMVLAKPAGANPRALAEPLAEHLRALPGVAEVNVAGPGFINLRLTPARFQRQISAILDAGAHYGDSTQGAGQKVMVEFCSANPTGPVHAGHMRGTIYGDVLASLLAKAGYDVAREYYINDAGRQIQTLVKSVHLRYQALFGRDVVIPEDAYPGDYVIDIAKKLKDRDGDAWLDATDDAALFTALRPLCVDTIMADIKQDLADLNIAPFDNFFSEYDMHQRGEVDKAIEKLRAAGHVYEGILEPPKGKTVEDYEPVELTLFRASAFGDDVDRPLKKSDGSFSYFAADMAYHADKLARGFDQLIDVFGADHAGAVKRLQAAVAALTGRKDALHVRLTQMVRFVKNGAPVRMSKRAGNFVTLRQILDEVGADAARFWFMNRKPDTQFAFDLAAAVEQNNDNPVFYVQYAHTRMCSVFRQQKEMGIDDVPLADVDLSLLTSEHELEMLRALCLYPLVIDRAARTREPHRVAFYAYDLAGRFHSWYNAMRFLDATNVPLTHARLSLVRAAQTVLAGALGMMGVSAPEKM